MSLFQYYYCVILYYIILQWRRRGCGWGRRQQCLAQQGKQKSKCYETHRHITHTYGYTEHTIVTDGNCGA